MTKSRTTKGEASGQALVPVLFIVLIMTAFAVTVSHTARREMRASDTFLREAQQYYIARGAIAFAAAELQQATNGGSTPPQLTPPPDTDANGWTQLGDGWYKVDIIDTSSRVNINTSDAATLGKLPAFQGNADIAAAIVDWRDSDDTPYVSSKPPAMSGTESDYYQMMNPPYRAKNAPFDTIDELLLVKGMTPAILYGPGAQGQPGTTTLAIISRAARSRQGTGGAAGSGQPAVDTSSSTLPLCETITTYSKELNVASDGTARVNVQTASESDLQTKAGLSAQLARQLVQQRQSGTTITSIADLLNIPGFRRDIMQQIGDKITVNSDQFRTGVLNINTASAEALATVPGVDATVYNAVIQARQTGTTFQGLNDLFNLTQLNRQQLQALVDHVCTKSSVYVVRVRVRIPGSPRVYAAQALIELTPAQQPAPGAGSPSQGAAAPTTLPHARILQWREVPRRPGWSGWVTPPSISASGGSIGQY